MFGYKVCSICPRNCLDAPLGQIVCDSDGIVDWCTVSSWTPLKPQHSIPCWLSGAIILVTVDPEDRAINGYSVFLKAPNLEPHYLIVKCHIQSTFPLDHFYKKVVLILRWSLGEDTNNMLTETLKSWRL